MAKIGLFFGTTTGKTEGAAEMIQAEFGGEDVVVTHDIADVKGEEFGEYENIIIGCPTWKIGELKSEFGV